MQVLPELSCRFLDGRNPVGILSGKLDPYSSGGLIMAHSYRNPYQPSKMSSIDQTIERLKSRGIGYKIVEEPMNDLQGRLITDVHGQPIVKQTIIVTSVPDLESKVNRFFSPYTPCFFKGCEELREQYKNALEKAGMTEDCTGCQKGVIMRKFEPEVRALIQRHEGYTNTRTQPLPRPNGSGQKGSGEKKSMLRRAADRVASLLGYRPK